MQIAPINDYFMDEEQKHTHLSGGQTWYALRTFHRLEQKISLFLEDRHLPHFIPMTYSTRVVKPKEGKETDTKPEKAVLVPAVHNLVFVKKILSQEEMFKVFSECAAPICVFRHPGNSQPCEISERDMLEMRMLCDPQYEPSVFVSQADSEVMVGKEVRVIAGPFKGLVGRLVRKRKQYYFLKTVLGVSVMVRTSRWYCEPL